MKKNPIWQLGTVGIDPHHSSVITARMCEDGSIHVRSIGIIRFVGYQYINIVVVLIPDYSPLLMTECLS